MTTQFALALLVSTSLPGGFGGGWTTSLASHSEHNWGSVERGVQLSHQFNLTNTTGKELRIKKVTPSCHCVSPMVTDYSVPPGGQTIIDARMDTSAFMGSKTVTITVAFDKPKRGELQLRVAAVSSGGANVAQTEVDFGVAAIGQKLEKKLVLDFTGAPDRNVVGVDFNKERVNAVYKELDRTGDKVRYELTLSLLDNLPIGLLEERIRVKTNDPKAAEMLVVAKVKVEGAITIVPDSFKIEQLTPGAKTTRNVIVKSVVPFRVVKVNNTLGMFDVRSMPDDKTVQMLSVTFTAPLDPGGVTDHLEFNTNLPDGKPIILPVVKVEKKH